MSNPIKPTIKTEIWPLLLVALSIVVAFYFYVHFPERVPTHWNIRGEVDGWSSRAVGAFLWPGLMMGMYVMFLVFPYLDPKKDRYLQFRRAYFIFRLAIMFILSVVLLLAGLNGLGYDIPVEVWTPMVIGLLFIVLGNYFGKIKPNWFMGIRTPWTLSSEEVWNKTHRLGGKIFILAGILMMTMALWPPFWQIVLFIAILTVMLVIPVSYSYFLYAREQKRKKTVSDNES